MTDNLRERWAKRGAYIAKQRRHIAELESLAESLYADYYDEHPDRAEEVYAERMKNLGLEVISDGD